MARSSTQQVIRSSAAVAVAPAAPRVDEQRFGRTRDWREKFSETAPYVFMRRILYDGKLRALGEPVPADVPRRKLRAMWDARVIRRADLVIKT